MAEKGFNGQQKRQLQVCVNDAVEDAFKRLKPKGWSRGLHFLREWGVLAAIIGLIGGLSIGRLVTRARQP